MVDDAILKFGELFGVVFVQLELFQDPFEPLKNEGFDGEGVFVVQIDV